jgi:hypothetical protein
MLDASLKVAVRRHVTVSHGFYSHPWTVWFNAGVGINPLMYLTVSTCTIYIFMGRNGYPTLSRASHSVPPQALSLTAGCYVLGHQPRLFASPKILPRAAMNEAMCLLGYDGEAALP